MVLKHVCKKLHLLRSVPSKPFLAMRFTTIFIFAGCLHVSARCYTQEKIDLSEKKAPLEKIFSKIRQQTGYSIWYDEAVLAKATSMDIELRDASLKDALDYICRNQPLTYVIVGKMVVITAREEKNTNSPPPLDVRGKVMNEKGEPLPGTTIGIKGSIRIIQADANGEFVLTGLDDKAILVVSNVGYQTQELKAVSGIRLNIRLVAAVSKLDEVQVIAYGTTTQRLSTGSISKVTAEEIARQPVSNPLQALEGRVAGLSISQQSGVPGTDYVVQLRGQNSIAAGNLPLYIIDGIPYPSTSLNSISTTIIPGGISTLNGINPLDIESIEVLKDAAATAIYGSRGANGVILITTKTGKAGDPKITLGGYAGFGKIARKMQLLNTNQYLSMRNEAFKNDGIVPTPSTVYAPDLFEWSQSKSTDWEKVLIGGSAKISNAEGSISGGNATIQYYIGGGTHRESTVFPGDFSDGKSSVHFNISNTSLNKKFKALLSASYVNDNNNLFNQDLTNFIIYSPNAPDFADGNGNLIFPAGLTNPFQYLKRKYQVKTDNLVSNALVSYQLLESTQLKITAGYVKMNMNELQLNPLSSYNPAFGRTTGNAFFANGSAETWIVEPQVNWQKTGRFGNLDVLFGASFQQNISQQTSFFGTGFSNDALLESIQAASSLTVQYSNYTQYRYNAFFGRIHYDFKNKYIIDLTGRRDGSSRFGPDRLFSNFGAVGAAWIFTQTKFIKDNFKFLSFGKLRGSYGTTGNDQIGDYQYLDAWNPVQFPYQTITGLFPVRIFNPYYSWERNRKLEMALEFGFYKDRIVVTIDYYRNRSNNQLVGYALPPSTGFTSIQDNLPAVVQNTGVEVEVHSILIRNSHFSWTSSFNITLPNNKLISYPGIEASTYANTYAIGQPLNIAKLFHYTSVNTQTGIYSFEDVNKDGNISYPDDILAIKKVAQNFFGGFQNNFNYKRWQLSVFLQFIKQTGYNYSTRFAMPGAVSNQPIYVLKRWQKPGNKSDIQLFTQDDGSPGGMVYNNDLLISDKTISDASFIRIKNVALSYTFHVQWMKEMKMQDAKFYIQTQNLFTFSGYQGLDPETQFLRLPPLRMVTAGIQVSF